MAYETYTFIYSIIDKWDILDTNHIQLLIGTLKITFVSIKTLNIKKKFWYFKN